MMTNEIKELLKNSQIPPKKRLGQNFLVDQGAVNRFLAASNIQKSDLVLEIGPGTGILTKELAKRAHKVIAIEKDQEMVAILKDNLKDAGNVVIIQGDIRKLENWKLEIGNSYKVVANIPYYLTAFLIRSFLEAERPPRDMALIVQKEVGQRMTAKPPDMNLLAVSVQFYAETKIDGYISRRSFWPAPKVDSAMVRISNIKTRISKKERDEFFKLVKAGFSQPRKQLLNNLARGLKLDRERARTWLLKNGIQPEQRAETLSVDDWLNLTKKQF